VIFLDLLEDRSDMAPVLLHSGALLAFRERIPAGPTPSEEPA